MAQFGEITAEGHLHVSAESKEPYTEEQLRGLRVDADVIVARYPQARSALLPLLHLVQSIDGYVTGRGIDFCAELLDLTTAEVSGVATFYTQYKRHPNGEYTVGVCTNTLCAIMGGDEIFERLSEHLDVDHDETTPDGKITLERVECNAACDYAPVLMTNWEFFDNQTPESATALVDDLRAGKEVRPTRGSTSVCTFKQMSRVLAGFSDGRGDEGIGAGEASLAGLRYAQERDWTAPQGAEATQPTSSATAGAAAERPGPAEPDPGEKFSSADTSDSSVRGERTGSGRSGPGEVGSPSEGAEPKEDRT